MLGVDCANFNVFCDQWASAGQCETNASYMDIYCAKACQRCTTSSRKVTQSINTLIITTLNMSCNQQQKNLENSSTDL